MAVRHWHDYRNGEAYSPHRILLRLRLPLGACANSTDENSQAALRRGPLGSTYLDVEVDLGDVAGYELRIDTRSRVEHAVLRIRNAFTELDNSLRDERLEFHAAARLKEWSWAPNAKFTGE